MQKLRAVIIGTGSISNVHALAIKESSSIELTACWNRAEDEELGRLFEENHGAKYYSDLARMLEAEKPDIAINALPPKHRLLGLEKAAKLGARLVLEKPMALNVEECKKIKCAAEKYNAQISVTESSAYNKILRSIQESRNATGKPLHMLLTNYRKYFSNERSKWIFDPDECNGGMILNVGVHRIAAMRLLCASKEKKVTASIGSRPPEIPVQGDCSIRIEYENGAIGTLLMCGYFNHGNFNPNIQHITTDKGHIRIEEDSAFFSNIEGKTVVLPQDEKLSNIQYVNFYKELEFSIASGSRSLYGSEDGMRDVAVVQAAMLSNKEKRTVEMEEALDQ